MRVLIATLSYKPNISGVAVSVELLTKYLVEQGHQVFIVAPAQNLKNSVARDPTNGATVYRVRSIPNPIRRGFYLPVFTGAITERIFQEVKPDIIHVHDPLAMSRYFQESGRRRGVPTVVSIHFTFEYIGAYMPRLLRPMLLEKERRKYIRFYNQCQAVITPSRSVISYWRRMGIKRPIFALSNGVDIERFFSFLPPEQTRKNYRLPNLPLILYLGRLDKDKAIDVLIKAVKEVSSAVRCHLVLVGGGDKRKKLSRLIKRLSLGSGVTFTGPIPHSSLDLVALYQAADIFVMPSAIETQSITTLEAMATGKPVIAANAGALPELIADGRNGLLFAPGDSNDLAKKLITLVRDKPLQERLSEAAVVTATEHELRKSLRLFVELYTATISHSPSE